MLRLPKDKASLWADSHSQPSYPELVADIEVDAAVVGGGICGLSAAYFLKQAGLSVAVLEKDTIGSGTSGRTTGKVTSQHGLIYDELVQKFNNKTARLYGEAAQTAISQIEKIIKAEKIDCDWQRDDNYVFSAQRARIPKLRSEAATAARLGLPASFEASSPLPFKIAGAVKFADQAKFNSQKYMDDLAKAINNRGSYVYENSRVISIKDGRPARISSKHATVIAKNIIVATNVPTLPLIARGAYCLVEYPRTSYIVAGEYKGGLSGMYISPDEDHYSILPVKTGGKNRLLIGGNDHIRGKGRAEKRHQQLADYGQTKLSMTKIEYRWGAWDYLAYDGIPLVGKVYPWSKHLYIATAFKKWGLTSTTVAAMILRDRLTGQKNDWAQVFDSQRISPIKSIPSVIAKTLRSA
jgi:glycine/D-amino acid oxidase-like deaminating enzyme